MNVGLGDLNSLKEHSVAAADEIIQSKLESEIHLMSEPHVDDPVIFLKQFFKKKEFKPQRRRFKPPKKIVYKEKGPQLDQRNDVLDQNMSHGK